MKKFKEVLDKYNINPKRYQFKNNVVIVDCDQGKYVLKPRKSDMRSGEVQNYLDIRSFNYFPKIVSGASEEYEITEYEEDIDIPGDQKITDLVNLVALLHNKTSHYVEVDEDDFKEIYEDVSNNIEYLSSYYNDIAENIENKVYMSPSEYIFIRNISKIYQALAFCKSEIEKWYDAVKEKRKNRYAVVHNNLQIDHFIRNKNSYLISWDKSKIDMPIFDLYKLYKKHALDYEFSEVLNNYERSYPLLEEERMLLFTLMALPDKIDFDGSEYENCRVLGKKLDMVYKTEMIISPYYSKDG